MATDAPSMIGFPPPLLGDRPLRLPVHWNTAVGMVMEKPPGVQVLAENWYPRAPVLVEAINYQAAQGKPELERLGLGETGVRAIFSTEPDLGGLALFAKDPETGEFWANAYGSNEMVLRFQFVAARAPEGEEALQCDLPLARHRHERRVLVSNKTGKRASTQFRRLVDYGRYSLWEASMSFYRMHQLPLHAFEVGLPIVGDERYADEPEIYLSRLKRGYQTKRRAEEVSLWEGIAAYLAQIEFPLPDGTRTVVSAPPPKRLGVMLRHLGRYARG